MKLDNEPYYGKSAKKEETGRIVKASLYAEYLGILIKKMLKIITNAHTKIYALFLLYLRMSLEDLYFISKLNSQKMPELIKSLLGNPLVCFNYIHFTNEDFAI